MLAYLALVMIAALAHPVFSMVGYDCGSSAMNITTVSLLTVGECNIPSPEVEVHEQYIELLQLNEFAETEVLQCKIEIFRVIFYCGMSSHIATVDNAQLEYIEMVSRDACKDMHKFGKAMIGQTIITGIQPNRTTRTSITFAGSVKNDGTCYGASYADPYGSWNNVVVQGTVKISLRNYMAQVSLESNQIYLRSGTVCALLETNCQDADGGNTFWDSRPLDNCKFDRYGILFDGIAKKIRDVDSDVSRSLYSVTTTDVTFALTSRETHNICGYEVVSTEHPKLFIFETTPGTSFAVHGKVSVANLDIFAYVNSKFLYVERHIRQQMKSLYHDVLKRQCDRERQILQNSLAIASQAPDEFAFRLMKGPGYMALVAGEVVHIVKCIPVEVTLLRLEECYNQLPVARGNETFFLTPRTHILSHKGTQTTCNRLLPPYYLFGDAWYKFTPIPEAALPPEIMRPTTKQTWKYTNPASLAASGIYTKEDTDNLRQRIMFPLEKPVVIDNIVRGINGESTVNQGERFVNLLDENSIKHIAESAWKHTWGRFIQFGTASAGFIGILLIFRAIKLIVDTIVHGYALHTVYGWSIYLLGAVWSSITNLLIHLGRQPKEDVSDDVERGMDLEKYQSSPTPRINKCPLHQSNNSTHK
ncbi:uncharacterized protein [Venturia canescens]|uniref:uncharacterized protein n=1 Tax=Venturia canescens TaxID=32260 RepID=UPI001C9D4067|nr:uncharacterized protein LOC122407880 [Venturia canescens]XP_043270295.1 uncharacterized protein LOC122407890 [Venturia canescens]XP_043270296.1 uncharacterized protein LOC122407890 [Venturia canescens]XP_043270310.1 uncharacterized protein LOC122407900 [Venturia canescens]XP_043271753.1 uncharacterized protein LOC122408782 [Venturia canescens]XP_043271754.1 uncharacterized protein LOC122408782 [Venturia canescens]XP_043275491.1 uncharacterized protein LOC122411043 [Venturia canescens]